MSSLYALLLITLAYFFVLPLEVFFALTTNGWVPPAMYALESWLFRQYKKGVWRDKPFDANDVELQFITRYWIRYMNLIERARCKESLTWYFPLLVIHAVGTVPWIFCYAGSILIDCCRLCRYLCRKGQIELRPCLTMPQIPWMRWAPESWHLAWAVTVVDASHRSFGLMYTILKALKSRSATRFYGKAWIWSLLKRLVFTHFFHIPFRAAKTAWTWSDPWVASEWKRNKSSCRHELGLRLSFIWYIKCFLVSIKPLARLRIYRTESGPWNFNPIDPSIAPKMFRPVADKLVGAKIIKFECGALETNKFPLKHACQSIALRNGARIIAHASSVKRKKLGIVDYNYVARMRGEHSEIETAMVNPRLWTPDEITLKRGFQFSKYPILVALTDEEASIDFWTFEFFKSLSFQRYAYFGARGHTLDLLEKNFDTYARGKIDREIYHETVKRYVDPQFLEDAIKQGFWEPEKLYENMTAYIDAASEGRNLITFHDIESKFPHDP